MKEMTARNMTVFSNSVIMAMTRILVTMVIWMCLICLMKCGPDDLYSREEAPEEHLILREGDVQHRSLWKVDEVTKQVIWSPSAIIGFSVCLIIGTLLALCCLYFNFKGDDSPDAYLGKKVFH